MQRFIFTEYSILVEGLGLTRNIARGVGEGGGGGGEGILWILLGSSIS